MHSNDMFIDQSFVTVNPSKLACMHSVGFSMDKYTTVDLWAFLKQDMSKQVCMYVMLGLEGD